MAMQRKPAADPAPGRARPVHTWLGAGTLATVADLNDQCLELLCQEARGRATGAGAPLLTGLSGWWGDLEDPQVRARAAQCPYLLVNAGFADAWAWTVAAGHSVHDRERRGPARFFSVRGAERLLQQALAFAWHLARSEPPAARLLLGMSAECAGLLAGFTIRQVADLAERHPEWLQPRWPARVSAWEELLSAAIRDDSVALEQAHMRGLQLLAAEASGVELA